VAELDDTVTRMLESETFGPDELTDLLVEQGHPRADVVAAVERASAALATRAQSPAQARALARSVRAGRLIRAGIFVFVVGLASTAYLGGGVLQLLLVLALGGALVAAGFRERGTA
jgi:hypothetical protein